MGLFGIKNKKNYAISLDIGTEYVKVLVFRLEHDTAYVVGASRAKQQLSDMQGGRVTDIYGVIKNCNKALDEAFEQAKIAPRQCVIGIAGELVKGATTTVHYRRQEQGEKLPSKSSRRLSRTSKRKHLRKIEVNWRGRPVSQRSMLSWLIQPS